MLQIAYWKHPRLEQGLLLPFSFHGYERRLIHLIYDRISCFEETRDALYTKVYILK